MKVNPNKMYIVYTPFYRSRKGIFDGSPTTMQQLKNKFKRGLDADVIDSIFYQERS